MIRLIHEQLAYDVRLQAWKATEANVTEAAETLANKDSRLLKENEVPDDDAIRRWCETGVALLHLKFKDKISQPGKDITFWEGEKTKDAHDDALNPEVTEYDFELSITADEKALAMLFHNFVVRYALWQWALLCKEQTMALAWQKEADALAEGIENELYEIGLPRKKRHEDRYGVNPVTSPVRAHIGKWEDLSH